VFPIGVSPWVWASPVTDDVLADLVPKLATWGFEAIELPLEQVGDWDAARTRDLLAEHGLTPVGVAAVMAPGRDLVSAPDVSVAQEYLRSCVDAAAAVGAPAVGGPMYAVTGRTWRIPDRGALYASWRTAFGPVAAYAADAGVALGIEALNRYETSVVNTVVQTIDLIDGLPSNVGIMLDSYHMNIEEKDPYTAVTVAGPYIKHVQVSGTDRGAPGSDHLDWTRWLGALAETGYQGSICIESFTGENEAIAVAASIWRPLAPTQDRLATDGLAYLRSLRTA
jgi:D-psicose/D-tagatose/L-ribulose 3-epimerase